MHFLFSKSTVFISCIFFYLPAKSNARTNEVHIFVRKPQSRQTTAIVPAVILALPEMDPLCNRDERMRTSQYTKNDNTSVIQFQDTNKSVAEITNDGTPNYCLV